MKQARAFQQRFFTFRNFGVGDAAIDRAGGRALLVVEKPYTFGAFPGNDIIDVFGDWRMRLAVRFPADAAFVNRIVGTSRQTRAAVDAFLGNNSRHWYFLKMPQRAVTS